MSFLANKIINLLNINRGVQDQKTRDKLKTLKLGGVNIRPNIQNQKLTKIVQIHSEDHRNMLVMSVEAL